MSTHKSKKRKASHEHQSLRNGNDPDTSKPTAVFVPTGGRSHTVSVALPGRIIANAQSHEQKTYLAGSIARALAVFCVDEVIVFEDDTKPRKNSGWYDQDDDGYTAFSDPSHFLSHLLSYLETPPYMRKYLFPMHRNLRTAGTLPSLDMPHHIRANEWCEYREGVTIPDDSPATASVEANTNSKKKKKNKKHKDTVEADTESITVIDTGLPQKIRVPNLPVPENTRVTVKFTTPDTPDEAKPVAPSAPREEVGYYWGYNVRRCVSLSTVFTECPFDGGYDLSFGTSERGSDLSTILAPPSTSTLEPVPKSQHLLIVFGGVAGIEAAVKADSELTDKGVSPGEAEKLFDYWVNVLPGQGSRTIRTEEAVWLGLMGLQGVVRRNGL